MRKAVLFIVARANKNLKYIKLFVKELRKLLRQDMLELKEKGKKLR